MFVYFDKKIRSRISDLETARRRLKDLGEDEYDAAYTLDPDSDEHYSYYSWNPLNRTLSQLTALIHDCRCLLRFMDGFLQPELARIAGGPDTVRFSDLWFLFPTGSLIYCKDRNIPQKIWRVVQRAGGRRYLSRPSGIETGEYRTTFSPFVLECYHLDYDGRNYIQIYHQFQIPDFDGLQAVKSLSVIPFVVAERGLVNKDDLLACGEAFINYTTSWHHRHYSGRTYSRTTYGGKLSRITTDDPGKNVSQYAEQIDSEVIVDFSHAIKEVPWWYPGDAEYVYYQAEIEETGANEWEYEPIDPDNKWDSRLTDEFLEKETPKWRELGTKGKGKVPQGDDVLLLPDRVFAFVLRSRRWACLQIGKDDEGRERLREIEKPEAPWGDLKLPGDHKSLVQSLIDSHFSQDKYRKIEFDLINSKGNGVIILLHGVPGVGKTSTAECAAKTNRKPLLPITCGDLGLNPEEVESNLQNIFRLAQSWDCILLLDEADVFLAQRTVTDINRNALVSVFLRSLEYYKGVLFLTTNRVGVFDEAFKSRIHMSLYYPPLEEWQTKEIWKTLIQKAVNGGIQVEANDLEDFATTTYRNQSAPGSGPVWNGRQIRNAFQSALALAAFHANSGEVVTLNRKYFQKVFDISNKFSTYIWQVRQGLSDAEWNKMAMVRRDDFIDGPASLDSANTMASNPTGQFPPPIPGFMPALNVAAPQPGGFFGQKQPQNIPSVGYHPTQTLGNPMNGPWLGPFYQAAAMSGTSAQSMPMTFHPP
ncbi:P-loop containing nucleoside triphosphate hydrolase protein [Aspergillus sclerotiicarbonarius CBS 121057]|uniref:P-loop containing nucleoside triphosphate hydrolase protein n=1 Tax=Aspergillus sclerotiicarbonarius (strain CBS 121057 / IBT 28362) TaxID=1448318 RepID=A0A319EG20_ASPSB|nr:P-loop containing nucleoside triphosphate hydrolase protein [Aspergillus sclerotiicarbonarius CBS 121057]